MREPSIWYDNRLIVVGCELFNDDGEPVTAADVEIFFCRDKSIDLNNAEVVAELKEEIARVKNLRPGFVVYD